MRTFVLLALPGVYLSSLHSALDVLRIGDRHVREHLRKQQARGRLPTTWVSRVVSVDERPVAAAGGTLVPTDGDIRSVAPEVDAVFIPAMDWLRPAHIEQNLALLESLAPWLVAAHAHGALIAAHHAGVCAVAEAGLLADADAAVPIPLAAWFRRRYPRVHSKHIPGLVPFRKIITAAALDQGPQLACHLVDRFARGVVSARSRQEVLQVESHAPQAPDITPSNADPLIQRAQGWLTARLIERPDTQALARHLSLSERSLFRRFQQKLGMTPLQYLQVLRLETALAALERTTWSVEAVAHSVGYEDAAFFGRLFRRRFGQTPGAYRRQLRKPSANATLHA